MGHAATHDDPTLARIADAIAGVLHPRRIVLIGSRARGDAGPESDYDIVVEVADGTDTNAAREWASRTLHHLDCWIDVIVCTTGEIARWQDDPGMLHWDISREGVQLYPAGEHGYERLEPRPRVVREQEPESVEGWLERAGEDLKALRAITASRDAAWGAAAFHAQQAAEKYLKAVLVQHWIKPPHHHDLSKLVDACLKAGGGLPDLSAECALLNQYAVDVRYPLRTPIPDAADGRRAADAGRRIVQLAMGVLDRASK